MAGMAVMLLQEEAEQALRHYAGRLSDVAGKRVFMWHPKSGPRHSKHYNTFVSLVSKCRSLGVSVERFLDITVPLKPSNRGPAWLNSAHAWDVYKRREAKKAQGSVLNESQADYILMGMSADEDTVTQMGAVFQNRRDAIQHCSALLSGEFLVTDADFRFLSDSGLVSVPPHAAEVFRMCGEDAAYYTWLCELRRRV